MSEEEKKMRDLRKRLDKFGLGKVRVGKEIRALPN